jgi:hypothetical protein
MPTRIVHGILKPTRLDTIKYVHPVYYTKSLYCTTKHTITSPSTALRSKQPTGSDSLDPFDHQFALNLDKQDSLAPFRDLFHIPRCAPYLPHLLNSILLLQNTKAKLPLHEFSWCTKCTIIFLIFLHLFCTSPLAKFAFTKHINQLVRVELFQEIILLQKQFIFVEILLVYNLSH